MKIQLKTLMKFTASETKRINIMAAYKIILKNYCGPMTVSGLCPADCEQCKPAILRMFDLGKAVNPAALLTYLTRVELAKAKEEAQKAKMVGLISDLDPFEELLGEL